MRVTPVLVARQPAEPTYKLLEAIGATPIPPSGSWWTARSSNFALVNALLRPIVGLLSCPLVIDGWLPAILGGIVMAVASMVLESVLQSSDSR
jgi:hypothetical protein